MGRSPLAMRRGPRPYSPEYGAAPFGRCWKIPAKRPSQIETLRFDLKRRSHRAIRSFRSITVLRKRSERRVLRHGPPARLYLLSPRCERRSLPQERKTCVLSPSRRSAKCPVLRLRCSGQFKRIYYVSTDRRYSTFSSIGRVPSTRIIGQSTDSSHFSV